MQQNIWNYFTQQKNNINKKYTKRYTKLYNLISSVQRKYYIKLLKIKEKIEEEKNNMDSLETLINDLK